MAPKSEPLPVLGMTPQERADLERTLGFRVRDPEVLSRLLWTLVLDPRILGHYQRGARQ